MVALLELAVGNPELLALVVAAERMLVGLVVLEIRHQLPQAKEIMAGLAGHSPGHMGLVAAAVLILLVKRVAIRLAELAEMGLYQHF